ncbi:hypothetical protein H8356DRAFT_1416822 [Neocallimastix lanati (nom. inval.)]|nr:hypothetical protein H8356DRAFT_1416822 [Neocallimastix sp. JGI-2020a]
MVNNSASGLNCLQKIYSRIWNGEFPSTWNEASIISIPKKGDDHRGMGKDIFVLNENATNFGIDIRIEIPYPINLYDDSVHQKIFLIKSVFHYKDFKLNTSSFEDWFIELKQENHFSVSESDVVGKLETIFSRLDLHIKKNKYDTYDKYIDFYILTSNFYNIPIKDFYNIPIKYDNDTEYI